MPKLTVPWADQPRPTNSVRAWMPLLLYVLTTLLALGVLYGKLGGRLDLIEYRLLRIEKQLGVF